jgi:hypothetical protein
MKRAIYCVICKGEVDLIRGINLDHDCGCYSHARCHGSEDADPQCALHNPGSATAKLVVPLDEPRYPGKDWVSQGYVEPSKMHKMYKLAKRAESPYVLMEARVPIEDMIRRQGWGLGQLYNDWGVRLDDFLRCGYSIDQLQTYEDMRKRPLDTLKALGLNADTLLDYADLMPADELRKRFGMTVQDIQALQFDPKRGLCTPTSSNWHLDNLIYLGYKWRDLVTLLGLRNPDHWDALAPTTDHLKQLECTQKEVEEYFGVTTEPLVVSSPSAVPVSALPPQTPPVTIPPRIRRNRILK